MQRERRGKNVVYQLSVTLEDLYNGATRKLALQKNVICDKCEGRGSKKGAVECCPNCRGTGMQIRIHQIGPGMVQQIQSVCMECQGHGERISPKDRCKSCNGRKIVGEKKILEVHIDKGMKDGQKITFHGEGDQEPGLEPGDIIIVLDQKDHAVCDLSCVSKKAQDRRATQSGKGRLGAPAAEGDGAPGARDKSRQKQGKLRFGKGLPVCLPPDAAQCFTTVSEKSDGGSNRDTWIASSKREQAFEHVVKSDSSP
ncbi:dnaJ homolog subfamily A member 1-like [Marmota marmota marmota]|uniref:dnaJ homolog subfamily A member 1-like n=1 Tax=Marmota marmota marmota TaxID=9994 RepID=UPI0020933F85|nr:dnaJ homolog subfamily A member 1-like [Marmota marmota marmota]